MTQRSNESDNDFNTRRYNRHVTFKWSMIGGAAVAAATVILAADVVFGWGAKIMAAINSPDKVQKVSDKMEKLSDIVWQDHQAIQRIEDMMNIKDLQSPKERSELSNLFGTNAVLVAESNTNTPNQ